MLEVDALQASKLQEASKQRESCLRKVRHRTCAHAVGRPLNHMGFELVLGEVRRSMCNQTITFHSPSMSPPPLDLPDIGWRLIIHFCVLILNTFLTSLTLHNFISCLMLESQRLYA